MNTQIKQMQKGFTLVELLVVIAIIGILTAIGVPMYNGYQASAKVSATKQNLDSMKTFIAGEVTKCSAGLVPQLKDPKGITTVDCPAGLATPTAVATYFTNYGLATMKNPYNTSSTTAVNSNVPSLVAGELGISGATAGCTGIAIQTLIIDPAGNGTATVSVPVTAECISLQ